MTSNSRKEFDENFEDIEMLLDIEGGLRLFDKEDGKSSEDVIDVLYRSAIVLMVSHWEAYVEDICSEALKVLVSNTKEASKLPKEIKKQVAKEVEKTKNEIELWKLADKGWKKYLKNRLGSFKERRDRSFNTPKSTQTEEFIYKTLGLSKITSSWKFKGYSPIECKEKLDNLITIRGQIAHRGKLDQGISKKWLTEYIEFLKNNTHIKKTTGKGLW